MALTKQIFLTLISIFGLLFLTIHARETYSPKRRSNILAHSIFPVMREGISAPAIQGASTSAKQQQAIIQKTDAFIATIGARLGDKSIPEKQRKCLSKCKGVLPRAIEHLKRCIQRINGKKFWNLTLNIDEASYEVGVCRDCFSAEGIEYAEFKDYDEWYKGMSQEASKSLFPAVQEERHNQEVKDAQKGP
ncbi:hypothetical protein OSB04_015250 [Centaurea solstitialis]|uniref:Uncharacterized protein n=1 Tax=Centaurea solstitialis TaxID=347529 RepID=A0AA38SYN0_9ASTR|nr:hypothetical protein OSB04_015250 [Centaurea solstitialis]